MTQPTNNQDRRTGGLMSQTVSDAFMGATEMQSLLERVEAATGADRELDCRILASLLSKQPISRVAQSPINGAWCAYVEGYGGRERLWDMPSPFRQAGAITASLDAALALCERVLPGCCWRVHRQVPAEVQTTNGPFWATCGSPGEQEDGRGETPALALLAAMLKALIAQADKGAS